MRSSSSSQSSASSESNISVDPTIKSVKLTIPVQELPEHNETTLSVTVTSIDETNTTPKTGIVWHIGDTNIVEVNGTRLFARNEGHTTIQAEVRGVLSSARSIAVYKVIHGHRLPPEPDPIINNSILLGIDKNNDGVRDDVERWIYKTYFHPEERGIMLQSAYAYQQIIIDPSQAHETMHFIRDAFSCERYWITHKQELKDKYRYKETDHEVKKIQFNTITRHIAYKKYLGNLSGGVYSLPKVSKDKCLFDENGNLRAQP